MRLRWRTIRLAVTRMSNIALAALVQEQVGIRPLVHIACRDRNLIGTQSHMMGLDALGIDHVLAVTGDPATVRRFAGFQLGLRLNLVRDDPDDQAA